MSSKDIILQNRDLLFYLTDFLDDASAFKFLNTNKHYNTLINSKGFINLFKYMFL